MKKAIPSNRKRTETKSRPNPEVHTEAVKIMRTVGDHEAFHFYEAIGKPTGETARSLSDFLDKMKTVKSESLLFHLQRKDFQNWVGEILGDPKLAEKLMSVSSSNRGDMRKNICKTVENRIKELRTSSVAVMVDESLAVLLPSS